MKVATILGAFSYRNLVLASACAGSLMLGACSSIQLQNDIAQIEQQVQADANVLCGFIPTAATIAALIPGFGTVAASAATIAQQVCNAVAKAPVVQPQSGRLLRGAAAPDMVITTINTASGPVPIIGHFTR